jgi:hypothetical protein
MYIVHMVWPGVQVCRRLEAGDPHVHTHEYGDAMLKEDFAADSRYVVLSSAPIIAGGGGKGDENAGLHDWALTIND